MKQKYSGDKQFKTEQSKKVVTWSENSEVIEYKQNDVILADNSHELDDTVEYSDLPEKELNL